jgi:hypothetical protein
MDCTVASLRIKVRAYNHFAIFERWEVPCLDLFNVNIAFV